MLTELVSTVQNLRAQLNQVAKDLSECKKQQQEVVSTVQAQLTSLCAQFDEMSTITGPAAFEEEENENDKQNTSENV